MAHQITSAVLSLSDVTVTTVQPQKKLAHVEAIDPTILDLALVDCYVPFFMAYRLADNSEVVYSQLVKQIKESLQKVLVLFFPFAGRWTAVPRGSSGRRLLCNDAGVPFIEAYVDKDLDSVVKASAAFQPVPELQGHALVGIDVTHLDGEIMLPDGLPAIFVQVTRFKCGGVVLAVTFSHMLTDGKGFFNFMTAWSDLSRTNETAVKVNHDRAKAEIPSLRALHSGHQDTTDSSSGVAGAEPAFKPEMWAMKAFEVSASAVQSLKQEAKGRRAKGRGYVSTGDCITVHLWRNFAGLHSSMRGEKEILVQYGVEGRTRFYNPPQRELCGNVFTTMGVPDIPTYELLDMPLVSIAGRIRKELLATRREEWLSLERLGKVLQSVGTSTQVKMAITFWFCFPMYEMDFGFGNPYFAGLNNFNSSNPLGGVYKQLLNALGTVYVGPPVPNNSSSAAIVYLWSTPEVLEAFEHNPQFLKLFCVP